ncbi:RAMP superfamily protein [Clostridium acetireducens DSM 10703]|uniref:RAMP superfamily protein n=1 Tax=Clostridium acetireducens DSM 10703 TaxID=1121290 RepID=A0A1E8F149_9CLOT|nr:RAMP superfamily CRISPR-associated protein [Clostridium acetireducens]OFI07064.1 RAMP superfamily protein [Clostridium acetireducens DSM 10703]
MEKYFKFIPFINCESYEIEGNNSGKINITVKTLTPVHISSGAYDTKDNKTIYSSFIRNNGELIIPGTSFKGCIRNIAEALSRSCMTKSKNIYENKIPVSKREPKYSRCIICNMFGAMGYKSRIQFSDLKLSKSTSKNKTEIIKLPKSFTPNPNSKDYLNDDGKYKGYKFYMHGINGVQLKGDIPYEFVPKGTEFQGQIIFKELTDEQVQLLCFSLGITGDIHPKIGFGKSYLYGSIEVTAESHWVKKGNDYKNIDDKDIKTNIDKIIEVLNFENAVKNI